MGPRAQDAYLNLAGVLTDTGRADEAIAAYEKAIELGPSYARAHGALVQALCKSGRFTEAKAAADRFLSVLPTDDPNHQRAAQLVASCAAFLEYEKQLPDVLSGKAQPDPLSRRSFGNMCMAKGSYADALRLYEEAFAAAPELAADLGGDARLHAACAAVRVAEQIGDAE